MTTKSLSGLLGVASESLELAGLFEQCGLNQQFPEPTRLLRGWLDIIVTKYDCQVTVITTYLPTLSDHGLVVSTVLFHLRTPAPHYQRIRLWKSMDCSAFPTALQGNLLFIKIDPISPLSESELLSSKEFVMIELMDTLLPLRSVRAHFHPLSQ